MGVYIKGMEMPKSCIWRDGMCPLLDDYDNCKLQDCREEWTWQDQYKGCPLSEVPEPHGRLIDAEKLKNEYPHDTDWDYPVNTNCYVCESIDNAHTVIEAEGE